MENALHIWHSSTPFWITWKKGDVTEIRSGGHQLWSYAGSNWRKKVFPETSSLSCLRRYRMAESALTFARRAAFQVSAPEPVDFSTHEAKAIQTKHMSACLRGKNGASNQPFLRLGQGSTCDYTLSQQILTKRDERWLTWLTEIIFW